MKRGGGSCPVGGMEMDRCGGERWMEREEIRETASLFIRKEPAR